MGMAWDQAIKKFEADAPGRQGEVRGEGLRADPADRRRWSSTPTRRPDIMEYNKGNATAGLLSKQGLLTDLSDRGHQARLGQAAQPQPADHRQVRRQGRHGLAASGTACPNYGEYVMVYYNKDMFEKYGVAGADHARRVHRGDGHVRQARASRPLAIGRRRVPGPAALLPARAEPRPTARGSTTTSSTRARSTSTDPADLRRGHLRRLGEEGLHRQELGRASRPRTWASPSSPASTR